jgi:hypothetical protein
MGNRLSGGTGSQAAETVIPFAPAGKSPVPNDADQLDLAGRTILSLLNKAAGAAEENSRQALNLAQKFSQQLRASEDRIAELELEVRHHQDRADRAEQWLHKIYTELEERFFSPNTSHSAADGPSRSRIRGA